MKEKHWLTILSTQQEICSIISLIEFARVSQNLSYKFLNRLLRGAKKVQISYLRYQKLFFQIFACNNVAILPEIS